jgi:hypothetical protein
MPIPVEVRFLSTNVTPEVGANDGLVAVRVVPAGRDGTKVYGRTLKSGEIDPGVPVTYDPYAGEELHFRPGSIQILIGDVPRTDSAKGGHWLALQWTRRGHEDGLAWPEPGATAAAASSGPAASAPNMAELNVWSKRHSWSGRSTQTWV